MQQENERFAVKSRLIHEILNDPGQRTAAWEDFRRQKEYKTFRAFLWSIV